MIGKVTGGKGIEPLLTYPGQRKTMCFKQVALAAQLELSPNHTWKSVIMVATHKPDQSAHYTCDSSFTEVFVPTTQWK